MSAWAARADIIKRIIDRYSHVLDVHPSGQDADYLVWTGLDVPNTYGDPTLEPDAEDLSVAILMLEGIGRAIQTTNWDGLIEAALAQLTSTPETIVRVVVTPDDFHKPERRSDLLKFHGCAVRARDDESTYRRLLIARKSQISGGTTRPENRLMKERVQYVYSTRPALVVGLSAQDADIHTVFNQAIENLQRNWSSSPPGVMVASQRLEYHHKHVLRITYGDAYAPNDTAITSASLLGAYAKPALAGLVLFTLADKLRTLLGLVPELDASELDGLETDLLSLRDNAATAAGADERTFINAVIGAVSMASLIFRQGRLPTTGMVPYLPISPLPIDDALQDPDYPKEAFGRMALALALLSRAHNKHDWRLSAGSPSAPTEGVITVETSRGASKVFVVQDTRESLALVLAGYTAANPDSIQREGIAVSEANSAWRVTVDGTEHEVEVEVDHSTMTGKIVVKLDAQVVGESRMLARSVQRRHGSREGVKASGSTTATPPNASATSPSSARDGSQTAVPTVRQDQRRRRYTPPSLDS